MLYWHVLPIFNRQRVIQLFHFDWDFPTAGEMCGVFAENDCQKVKILKKNTCLKGTSLRQDLEGWTPMLKSKGCQSRLSVSVQKLCFSMMALKRWIVAKSCHRKYLASRQSLLLLLLFNVFILYHLQWPSHILFPEWIPWIKRSARQDNFCWN